MNRHERASLNAQLSALNDELARQKVERSTIAGDWSVLDMRVGDRITLGWKWRNPDRRWWQFWKPRFVDPPLMRVVSVTHSTIDVERGGPEL